MLGIDLAVVINAENYARHSQLSFVTENEYFLTIKAVLTQLERN